MIKVVEAINDKGPDTIGMTVMNLLCFNESMIIAGCGPINCLTDPTRIDSIVFLSYIVLCDWRLPEI